MTMITDRKRAARPRKEKSTPRAKAYVVVPLREAKARLIAELVESGRMQLA